jgi:hypothetical protein
MTTTVFKVRSKELPKTWAERAGVNFDIDTEVEVTLTTPDQPSPELLAKLDRGLRQGEQGKTHGPFDTAEEIIVFLDKSKK